MDRELWLNRALERYEAPLLRYAAGLLRNLETARDVVQDTFLRLCRADPEKVDHYLGQWLFAVCRNRAMDLLRRRRRINPLPERDSAEWSDHAPLPDRVAANREYLARILQLLESLPRNQREVLRLKFQEDLSYKEISAVTQLSVSNVGFLIHTGIKNLRQALGAEQAAERKPAGRVS